jgi:hypothetical protein
MMSLLFVAISFIAYFGYAITHQLKKLHDRLVWIGNTEEHNWKWQTERDTELLKQLADMEKRLVMISIAADALENGLLYPEETSQAATKRLVGRMAEAKAEVER